MSIGPVIAKIILLSSAVNFRISPKNLAKPPPMSLTVFPVIALPIFPSTTYTAASFGFKVTFLER